MQVNQNSFMHDVKTGAVAGAAVGLTLPVVAACSIQLALELTVGVVVAIFSAATTGNPDTYRSQEFRLCGLKPLAEDKPAEALQLFAACMLAGAAIGAAAGGMKSAVKRVL